MRVIGTGELDPNELDPHVGVTGGSDSGAVPTPTVGNGGGERADEVDSASAGASGCSIAGPDHGEPNFALLAAGALGALLRRRRPSARPFARR